MVFNRDNRLRNRINEQKDEIGELEKENMILRGEIERLSKPPFRGAYVLEIGEDTARVAVEGDGVYEVSLPADQGPTRDLRRKLEKGVRVVVNSKEKAIVELSEFGQVGTEIGTVDEIDEDKVRVSLGGSQKFIDNAIMDLKKGDEVLVDPTGTTTVERFDRTQNDFLLEDIPVAPWENIGGLEGTIQEIRDEIELPYLNPEVFERYGRNPIKGILLYGPPGCGKTMIAKSIAYTVSRANGKAAGKFINVKGPEILEKWVGNAEAKIRRIYQSARESSAETGAPTIVFIDEAEAVMKKRGSGISTDIYDSIVPQFLAEMSGVNGNDNVITVLATNREDVMDPAIIRADRIDRRIKVSRPDRDGTRDIFRIYLKDKPFREGQLAEGISEELTDRIFDEESVVYTVHTPQGAQGEFLYKHFVSGAMIKGIVDRGVGYAIKREIQGGEKGLTFEDLGNALEQEFVGNTDFSQSLVEDDWESIFGHEGKAYQAAHRQGQGMVTLATQESERRAYT